MSLRVKSLLVTSVTMAILIVLLFALARLIVIDRLHPSGRTGHPRPRRTRLECAKERPRHLATDRHRLFGLG